MLRYRHYLKSSVTSIGVHYCLAVAPHRICNFLMSAGKRHSTIQIRISLSPGFKSGDRDGYCNTFIRLAWRRALVARAVCEGAPSCINLIPPLFCRWGMQTGVSISFEYLKAFRLPLTTTHCVFIIFCDFQNYTSNDQNAKLCIFCQLILLKIGMHFAN